VGIYTGDEYMDTWLNNWVEEVNEEMDKMDIVNSSKRRFSIRRLFITEWRVWNELVQIQENGLQSYGWCSCTCLFKTHTSSTYFQESKARL